MGVTRPQASGLSLRILLKISSSLVVKIHQIGTKVEIVAREGGFFYGFAEQNPNFPNKNRRNAPESVEKFVFGGSSQTRTGDTRL